MACVGLLIRLLLLLLQQSIILAVNDSSVRDNWIMIMPSLA